MLNRVLVTLCACGVSLGSAAFAATPASSDGAYPDSTHTLAGLIAAMPKGLQRAEGPPLAKAVAAAQAAVAMCTAKGAKVSVLIADSVGEPVVILSGDGAGVRSRMIAESKVAAVIRFGMPSEQAAKKAETDPSVADAARKDPNIGMLRGGGFPVVRDGRMIGAVAASGASLFGSKDLDGECAQAALDVLQAP